MVKNEITLHTLSEDECQTPISGVVIIEAGKTAAMVDRNDLSLR